MRTFVIETRSLEKTYNLGRQQVRALKGVDLSIAPGEFVAIMGPSGSGKSTLMNLLGCLDRATSGEYLLDSVSVASCSDRELSQLRNRQLGFVFQSFHLLSRATALKNVEVPLLYSDAKGRTALAEEALAKVGLSDRLHHRPAELSGGQQQRVAIARALVNNPTLILADEPTGNLDSSTSEDILRLFDEINREGKTIVMVTHEEEVARRAQRVLRFRDGELISDEASATNRI
jgi:putative ABC transport system ATP-binding protein